MFICCYTLLIYICILTAASLYGVKSKTVILPRNVDHTLPTVRWQDDEGSGDKSDEDDGYADDEAEQGSSDNAMATTPISDACLKLQRALAARGLVGAYIPQCTGNADAMQMQCYTSGDQCWCVNSRGRQVVNSDSHIPQNCTFVDYNQGLSTLPMAKQLTTLGSLESTSHFTTTAIGVHNKLFDASVTDYNGSIPRATSSNDEQPSYNGSKTFMHIISSPETLWTYVLTEPNWSAAAVGVAGLILIVICLLILCIVYRFRKKDEGSYALDEPHRVSGLAVGEYTRAPSQDREFFA